MTGEQAAQGVACLNLCEAVIRQAVKDARCCRVEHDDIFELGQYPSCQVWMQRKKEWSRGKRDWFAWYCQCLGLSAQRVIELLRETRTEYLKSVHETQPASVPA